MTLLSFVIAAFVLLLIWLSIKWIIPRLTEWVNDEVDGIERRGMPTEEVESEWRKQ